MTTYTCKCKGTKIIANYVPASCMKCPYCNTTLVTSPNTPTTPSDHTMVDYVDNGGVTRQKCSGCGRTKKQMQNFGSGL